MELEHQDELLDISESKAIARCANVALPGSPDGEARKPSDDEEGQAPKSDDCDLDDADPSHGACLEDAKKLQKQGDLDDSSLHHVDAVFDIEQLSSQH